MSMAKIEIKNLVKKYGGHVILDNIAFTIHSGDVVGVIGENGAGKSTFLATLVRLIKPDMGDILYDNESIISNSRAIKGKVGYVPQDIALYEDLTGQDNLKYWAKVSHVNKIEINDRINNIKKIIGLDETILNKKVRVYSGGMKRRVNIGIALLNNPEVIVMDEPTVGIDIESKDYILKIIKELNKQGKTIIYASHYLDEIEELCNKICIMKKGRIIDFRDIEDINIDKENNKTIRQYYLDKNRNC